VTRNDFLWTETKRVFVTTVGGGKVHSLQKIFALHQNVRSLSGKITELEVLLQSDLKYVDVLCRTEHW
jgi:hypothetical protein